MKTKILIATLVAMAGISFNGRAQTILADYLELGIKSNLQLQQEKLHYEKSVQGLSVARALFMPQVGINASYTLADGGRRIQFPVGDLLNPVYATLNQLTDSQQFPQISNVNEQFLPNHFHDTKLRVIQPLFNPEIYFNYKAQKELTTVQDAQRKAYENEVKYAITAAYYQYLQTEEGLQLVTETRKLLVALVDLNKKLVANEKATLDAVLSAEYELNKADQQLADATKNREMAQAYFNFLLNRELQSSITIDSTLVNTTRQTYQLNELTSTALAQRQDLKQAQSGLLTNEAIVSLNKSTALLPKINVVGDVGYQGFEYQFDSNQQYWLLQFNLTWDLFKGGERRARTQQAKIDYLVVENKMAQLKKQIELQVMQSYFEHESARQAYATAQSGIRSAEKNFAIVKLKYEQGQALMIEFLDAQNKLTTARMAQSIRLFDVLRTEAQLQKTIAAL